MVLFLPDPDDPPARFSSKPISLICRSFGFLLLLAQPNISLALPSRQRSHVRPPPAADSMRPLRAGILGRSFAHGRGTDIVPDSIGDHSRNALSGSAGLRGSGKRRAYNHDPYTGYRNEALHDLFSVLIIGAPSRHGLCLIGKCGRPALGVHWMRIAPI
jgi:hypothetical protein